MAALKPIVFWGASGHARVLRELATRLGYELVALFDNDPSATSPFADVPIYFGDDGFLAWRRSNGAVEARGLVAIGGARGRERTTLQEFLRTHGVEPATVVHPAAFVASDAMIGAGSQVLAQASVCSAASLGRCCIINTGASADHECTLGDGVHLAPGAVLAGCVEVGANTLIGPGAVVLPRTRIGRDAVVGAGAVVTRNVPDGVVVYGTPARVIRENTP
jgi:sugar O-acyltransferase (sialic acid O-acetyltransferase NeuD family)